MIMYRYWYVRYVHVVPTTVHMPYYLTVLVVVLYGTALECPPVESIEYTNVMYCDRVQL